MKQRYIVSRLIQRSVGNIPTVGVNCVGTVKTGTFNATSTALFPMDTLKEYLSGDLGRSRPHGVVHKRMQLVTDDGPSTHLDPSYTDEGYYGVISLPYGGQNAAVNSIWIGPTADWRVLDTDITGSVHPRDWTIATTVPNEGSLIEDCYDKARGLKADVILNIVEANQIWPSITGLAKCIPILRDRWTTIRKLVRTTSGAYLAWKFGVSPILSDVNNIWKYLPKMADDIKRHGELDKLRFSRVKMPSISFGASDQNLDSINGYYTSVLKFQGRLNSSPSVRYVLVVKPTTKYHSQFLKAAATCMDRFATGPASLAWEHLPFSFIADWFIELRGMTRLLDDLVRSPPYEVVSFTRSFKYDVSTDVHVAKHSPCSGTVIQEYKVGTCSYKFYSRNLVPEGYTKPQWHPRFGKNQAGIAAALIAQKLTGAKLRIR